MSLGFLIKEGFSGLTRSKFPSLVAILTIAIALTLLGLSYLAGSEIYSVMKRMRSQFEIEVFLLPNTTEYDQGQIETVLKQTTGVAQYRYVSKDEAARRFQEEFGEDIYSVLDANPLPASYTIKMDPAHQNSSDITQLVQRLKKLKGVDEIKYRQNFLRLIERYYKAISIAGGILLLIILTASVLLVGNTIKLSIFAKREVIHIMRLVGATNRFIKTPFIVEGMLHGLLGALMATIFLYGILLGANYFLSGFLQHSFAMEPPFFGAIFLAGILFGLIGSSRSVRMFLNTKPAVHK